MRILRAVLIGALALCAISAGPTQRDQKAADDRTPMRDENDERFALTEAGCPEGRIKDYLERHGNSGVIDPELLLELNRNTYENREREKRIRSLSIGGTVWTSIGPANGAGRLTAATPHPTTGGTALIGAAGGGVWRTLDSGASWTVLTDSIPNLSVGAIAYAPSNTNIIYVGTGEGGYAGDFIPGFGLISSSTGGASWTFPSSVVASMFYRVMVDPSNANTLVIGTNNGAQRTTGGQNGPWSQVIASASAGATIGYGDVTDIVRDPSTPNTMYATTWDRGYWCQRPLSCSDPFNLSMPTVLKSIDGGVTWLPSGTGLPLSTATALVERMSIAIAPSSPSTLYVATAIYDSMTGQEISHVYKSTNSGALWTETSLSSSLNNSIKFYLGQQASYDNAIIVSPSNANVVMVAGVRYATTSDGGANWSQPTFTGGGGVHVDCHDLRYDAAGTLFIANDGGLWTSPDSGANATNRNTNLVTRQYYALVNDPINRNRAYGGQQDNGTSYRTDAGGTNWNFFTGSDGFQSALNERAASIVYSTSQYGTVWRSKRTSSPQPDDYSPRYDSSENTPFFSLVATDPVNPALVYSASYRVWKSTTGGDGWSPLPITTTDASTWSTSSTIRAFAISKSNPQIIMVSKGADVFRSTNGGTSWTRTITGLPGRYVTFLDINPGDPNEVFATLAGVVGTAVYYTTDGGNSWNPRGTGLPAYSAQVVRYDPTDATTLYCGTDVGVYRSVNSGANWSAFGTGLPAVSVYDVRATNDGSILRAATHGRGVWELTVTGNSNHAPTATITLPASAPAPITKGTTVTFNGTFTDSDGDSMTGVWFFPDSWSSTAASSGVPVSHNFYRPGRWPVTLTAIDSHGAKGAATMDIVVTEAGESCATPIVIPAAGPFPYTVTVNTEASTTEGTDPNPVSNVCYNFTASNSIWLQFTPSSSGTYTVSFCGSKTSTVVAGYTGNSCGPYTPTGFCFSNFGPQNDCSLDSTSTFAATAGTTYRFMITNYFFDDYGLVTFTIANAAISGTTPVIEAINPPVGLAIGGTPIVISGSGFSGGATVAIGGTPATSVNVLNSGLITATTGAHSAGTSDVTVTSGSTNTLSQAFTYVASTIAAPASLLATASSASQVNVTFSGISGADHYDIYRRATGGSFTYAGSTLAPPFPDPGRSANNSYLYKAIAFGGLGEVSADSNIDVATTTIFADDPLVATSTVIQAIHLTQLRNAVDAMERLAGITNTAYADPSPGGVFIQALHITQLRTRLDAARFTLGLSTLSYAHSLTTGVTPVTALDFTELRNGTK